MSELQLDANGLNVLLDYNLLPESEMRKAGFTDYRAGHWYYCKMLDRDISFNVSLPKVKGERLRIVVLDDRFYQPYDYQRYVLEKPTWPYPNMIRDKVENEMQRLSDLGIITGYTKGMYI